jgi:polyribonucleotide nucleotidyltransferase
METEKTQGAATPQGETKTTEKPEKTFSQAELDAVISDRLKREREKYSDYEALKEKAQKLDEIEEKNKTELEKATEKATRLEDELNKIRKQNQISEIREKVAKEAGIDAKLLTMETEEDCKAQAQILMDWHRSNPTTYPSVRDGGEVTQYSGTTNREKFAEWFDSIRR